MAIMRHQPFLLFIIGVSLFGLLVTIILALNPPITNENFFWRKPLVGSLFSLICILGALATLMPRLCSNAFHFPKAGRNAARSRGATFSKGHHPNCGQFSAHVILMHGYAICAACTGLFLGAMVAFVGTSFYFFGNWQIKDAGFFAVLIGTVFVAIGFFQLKFRNVIRMLLNVLFVVGAFLVLAGIDALVASLFTDLFLTAVIVFWIFTRIELSRWDHSKICGNCRQPCEVGKASKNLG